jgi:hypothetical protein
MVISQLLFEHDDELCDETCFAFIGEDCGVICLLLKIHVDIIYSYILFFIYTSQIIKCSIFIKIAPHSQEFVPAIKNYSSSSSVNPYSSSESIFSSSK